jgi:PD-(D/E)XK nuclease superfamily
MPAAILAQSSIKLAPSDFGFLWNECRRCFYLKVALGFQRPRGVMPSIFTAIDLQMKAFFEGRRTEEFGLPPGRIAYSGKWVESAPIALPGRKGRVHVRGPFDTILAFDDGTHAVVDFKTSHQKPENVVKYARQLHAYAYALEHPAPGKFALSPVTRLGLLVYEPQRFQAWPSTRAVLNGTLQWQEIPLDMDGFLAFLSGVSEVLEAHEPPRASPECAWCHFRDAVRQLSF